MVYREKKYALLEGKVYAVSREDGMYVRSATATDEVPLPAINGAYHQDEVFEARYLDGFAQ